MHGLNLVQSRHHAAIGGVALSWTNLEDYIQSILWRMARLNSKTGRCITHHMPFRAVCNAILTIANETPEYQHLAEPLTAYFNECEKLRVKRNDTVHGLWATFLHPEGSDLASQPRKPNEFEAMTIKARGSLKIEIRRTTIEEIDDISEEIIALSKRLAEFAEADLPSRT